MAIKIIPATNKEGYVPEVKRRAKPKLHIEPDWIKEFRLEEHRISFQKAKDRGDIDTMNFYLEYYGRPIITKTT